MKNKTSPCAYALATLRAMTDVQRHRVSVAHYQIFPSKNPSGSPRPARIVATAILTIGGAFRTTASIVRKRTGMALVMTPAVIDITKNRPETLPLSDGLARSVYNVVARAHVIEASRQYRMSRGGRN